MLTDQKAFILIEGSNVNLMKRRLFVHMHQSAIHKHTQLGFWQILPGRTSLRRGERFLCPVLSAGLHMWFKLSLD